MSETTHVDNVVIGSGQGGNPLAGWLAKNGQSVALIERDRIGGSCVNYGCTPTKTMIASARVAHLARRAPDYGVVVGDGDVTVDLTTVRDRKRRIVEQWNTGSERGLRRHDRLEVIFGEASFRGPRTIAVALRDGGRRVLTADRVFINTGTRNLVPPVPGLDEVPFLDNESAMELDAVPPRLLVLGGGYIGLEFSQMFYRFGSQGTVIEAAPRFLGQEDEDVAAAIVETLTSQGLTLNCCTRIEEARHTEDGGIEVAWTDGDGNRQTAHGSHLLVAAGRRPNTDALHLDAAGVDTDERGFIRVNDRLETTADGVWAFGDCKGGPQFTHIAYNDAVVLRKNLLEGSDATIADRLVPYTMFTDPQLGRVGLTEAAARDAGHDVKVASIPMSRVARAVEADETAGLMKAVVDAATDRILGAAIVGVEGGEVATVIQMAMAGGLTWRDLRDMPIAHPLLSESLNNLFATVR